MAMTGPMAAHAPVKVLLIDASATMRRLIRGVLAPDPRITVVGEAVDAAKAREMLRTLQPDVLTLDVEMPGQSGLDFLTRLMQLRPMPVVVVSSETRHGSAAAVEALARGAVECIGKPDGLGNARAFDGLADAIVTAASENVGRSVLPPSIAARHAKPYRWNGRIIVLGASTGGVQAIERVLARFPADCPPTVIVQHMPAAFLASFASRLDGRLAPRVTLASDAAPLRQGHVYLAPGGSHLAIVGAPNVRFCLGGGDKRHGHRPAVDVTMESAVPMAGNIVAAILTGMGRDGAHGLRALRAAGARTLAQDEGTSVVWGMPRAAWEAGGAEELVPLEGIAQRLLYLCSIGSAVHGIA